MPSGISTPRRRLLVVAAATIMAAAAGAVAFASQRETDRPAEDAPPPPPPEALAQATRDLDLPVSTSVRKEHAPGAVSVLVTRRQLLVGGDPNPLADFPEGLAALATTGLPARFKRSGAGDFHVPELASELSYFYLQGRVRDEPPALAVLADAATPYSVLSEILSTAAWSGFDDVELAVRGHDASLAWLASPMKRPRSPRSIDIWRARAPDLFVTGDGFSLRWGRGKPAPGCDPRAAGALVPKAGGAYDPRALAG